MRKVFIASNMLNEVDQIEEWVASFKPIADGGMLVVDGGSTDGTIELLEKHGVNVVVDNIIQREGYGPARNQLREHVKAWFPDAHWLAFFDADERILESDYHKFRFLKDYLIDSYDVIAFPRIDWKDKEMTEAAKDWFVNPDYQARMSRLNSSLCYIRRLHEQVVGHIGIFANIQSPKINHFHRIVGQKKRDFVGKVCAKLHMEDEYRNTYPEHHKENHYRELYLREGLNEN